MVVTLSELEKKILLAVNNVGQTNQGSLAKALGGMDEGELSRYLTLLQEKGALSSTKGQGNENLIQLTDAVTIEGTDVYAAEGVPFPLGDKLYAIMADMLAGKQKKMIPRMIDLFRANQQYQTPAGVRLLLTTFAIEPLTANAIAESLFPGSGMGPQGGMAGYQGYQGYQMGQPYQMVYGPNGQPIIIMNPAAQQYPGQQPIIVPVGNQPPQQPNIYVDSGQKRKIQRPMLDEKGTIKKDKDGEVLYEIVEEPITMQFPQQGSGAGSFRDAVEALKGLAETGRTVGILPGGQQPAGKSEHEKELEAKIEAMQKENRETVELMRKQQDDLKELMQKRALDDIKKEMVDSNEGTKAYIERLMKENDRDRAFTLQIAELQKQTAVQTAQFQAQLAQAQASGGTVDERLLDKGVSKVKEAVGGSLLDVYRIARATGGTALPPEQVAPQDAAAQLARMRQGA